MRTHERSDNHKKQIEAESIVSTGGTVNIHHFQHIGDSDKSKNRNAIKSFFQCTRFLCKQHIPHTTKFNKLVDLVVACGGKDLGEFIHLRQQGIHPTLQQRQSENGVIGCYKSNFLMLHFSV